MTREFYRIEKGAFAETYEPVFMPPKPVVAAKKEVVRPDLVRDARRGPGPWGPWGPEGGRPDAKGYAY